MRNRQSLCGGITLLSFALTTMHLQGCSSQPVTLAVPLNRAEAESLLRPGPYSVEGRIFFEPDQGHVLAFPDTVVSCASRQVFLIPYTDYSREWALAFFGRPVTDLAYRLSHRGPQNPIVGTDDLLALSRRSECDKEGGFSIKGVSSGDYFLLARVDWRGRDQAIYQFGYAPEDVDQEDGWIIKKFHLDRQDLHLEGPWP
jgi:hypothetical protein